MDRFFWGCKSTFYRYGGQGRPLSGMSGRKVFQNLNLKVWGERGGGGAETLLGGREERP